MCCTFLEILEACLLGNVEPPSCMSKCYFLSVGVQRGEEYVTPSCVRTISSINIMYTACCFDSAGLQRRPAHSGETAVCLPAIVAVRGQC